MYMLTLTQTHKRSLTLSYFEFVSIPTAALGMVVAVLGSVVVCIIVALVAIIIALKRNNQNRARDHAVEIAHLGSFYEHLTARNNR